MRAVTRTASWAVMIVVFGAVGLFARDSIAPGVGVDPVQAQPEHYKVLLDNDHVRVFVADLKPGEISPWHSHPAYVLYALTDGKARLSSPDGTVKEIAIAAGMTAFHDAEVHQVENIGDTEFRVLHVELKGVGPGATEHTMFAPDAIAWKPAPPSIPAGAQLAVLDGDPSKPGLFTARFKFPANYKIPPHWHPADEHVTVISGTLAMGMGDTLDESKTQDLSAGGFAVMPAKMHHYAFTKSETILQIHGMGPWGINYINPADDPRGPTVGKP